MFSLALVGADGAGKTTIGQQLLQADASISYVYMGINPAASNYMLPTTRLWFAIKGALGKETHQGGPPVPVAATKRVGLLAELKSLLRLLLVVPEELYRSAIVKRRLGRGDVVLLDRDYFTDFYAHDIAPTHQPKRLAQRLHGWYLSRFYRRPDVVVLLDAPAEVLFARKREGSLATLEARRQEYLKLRSEVTQFEVVDASAQPAQVLAAVAGIIHRRRQVGDIDVCAGE